jgi:hypothetical protein
LEAIMKKLIALALIGFVAACSGPKRVSVAEMGGGGGDMHADPKPEHKASAKDLEAHEKEARDCMGSIKDRARVMYAKNGKAALTFKELGISDADLDGKYCDHDDYAISGTVEKYVVTCREVFDDAPRDLILTCNLKSSEHKFNR